MSGGTGYSLGGLGQTKLRAKGNETSGFVPLGNPHSSLDAAPSPPAERVPAKPPVEAVLGARTVLGVKGSLRRANPGRALDASAPFRRDRDRDGRLRQEHSTTRAKERGRFAPIEGANRPES